MFVHTIFFHNYLKYLNKINIFVNLNIRNNVFSSNITCKTHLFAIYVYHKIIVVLREFILFSRKPNLTFLTLNQALVIYFDSISSGLLPM